MKYRSEKTFMYRQKSKCYNIVRKYKFELWGENMRKLIILRGNSGSGKSTIAKELQSRFGTNTMLISQDVIRRDMLKVKDGENTLALPLMKELLI